MTADPLAYGPFDDDRRSLAAIAADYLRGTGEDPRAGAELGWGAVAVPEAVGGAGGTLLDAAVIAEQAGASLAATSVPWSAAVLGPVAGAVPALAERVAAGGLAVAVAGTDLRVGPDGRMSGRMSALAAGVSHVVAPHPRAADAVVVVPAEARGVSAASPPPLDVTRPLLRLELADVAPGAVETVAWPDAAARWQAALALVIALDSVGIARDALRRTVDYAAIRTQFGRPIGSFQAYQHRCASAYIELKLAQSLAFRAAQGFFGPNGARDAIAACLLAGPAATFVAGEAIQLHGAVGYTWELGLHRHLRRARVNELLLPRGPLVRRTLDALRDGAAAPGARGPRGGGA